MKKGRSGPGLLVGVKGFGSVTFCGPAGGRPAASGSPCEWLAGVAGHAQVWGEGHTARSDFGNGEQVSPLNCWGRIIGAV